MAACDTSSPLSDATASQLEQNMLLREDVNELEKMNVVLLDQIGSLESRLQIALEVASDNLSRAEKAEAEVATVRTELYLVTSAVALVNAAVVAAPVNPPLPTAKAALEVQEVMLELENVAMLLQERTERCAELEDELRSSRMAAAKEAPVPEPHQVGNMDREYEEVKPSRLHDATRDLHASVSVPQPLEEPEEEQFVASQALGNPMVRAAEPIASQSQV